MIFGLRRSPPPVIRLLRPDRSQACARLHAEGFAHPWSPEEMASLIGSSSTVGAAALDPVSGRLRGFVLSRLAADEAEILTIAVDAAHQGRGVGRALLSENLRQVANAGARAMFLEVAKDNAPRKALPGLEVRVAGRVSEALTAAFSAHADLGLVSPSARTRERS